MFLLNKLLSKPSREDVKFLYKSINLKLITVLYKISD